MKNWACLAAIVGVFLTLAAPAGATCPAGTTDPNYCSPSAPDVTTTAATSITSTGATLNGTVNPNGQATTYTFEYGTTTAYGTSTTATSVGSTDYLDHPLSAVIAGLAPGTTYHFRITASNASGMTNGGDLTFTTAPAAPTVQTQAATGITSTGATLNGTVNPNGAATTYTFEYGTTTAYGTVTTAASAGNDTTVHAFTAALTGLTPNTTYHYRINATNSVGTTNGTDATFTTPATGSTLTPPTVATGSATAITNVAATLSGTVNPNGKATTYKFEYGTTTAYGSSTTAASAGSDSSVHSFTAAITGLTANTLYHFRITATNADGTTNGTDVTFMTTATGVPIPNVAPTATTGVCGPTAQTTTSLSGSVNPNGLATSYAFQYGTTTSYGSTTPVANAGSSTTAVAVSASLTGLSPSTTYHYRLVAASAGGTTPGADATCTTPPTYTVPGGKLKPALTLKARPKRDKRKPYVYKAAGTLKLPAGVSATTGCQGRVRITVRRNGKLVLRKTASVRANCKYTKKFAVTKSLARAKGFGRRGGLRVRARFAGNDALLPKSARKTTVKYGRKRKVA